MKNLIFAAISLTLLTSCKYHGMWDVKEQITLKTESKDVVVGPGKQGGRLGISRNKLTLVFQSLPRTPVEIKIPKGTVSPYAELFQVDGTEIGQNYNFMGSTKSVSHEEETECQHYCEDSEGRPTECFPQQSYACTIITTTTYISLHILDTSTNETKASFSATVSGSHTKDDRYADDSWNSVGEYR